MTCRSRSHLLLLAVVSAAFAFRAPLVAQRVRLTPDAISYCNIAHNIASGQGFTSTLRLYCSGSVGVGHEALCDWPPLYPYLAAFLLGLGGGVTTLQVFNALLVSVSAGLVLLIGVRLFDYRVGLFAGAAAALAPNMFRAGSVALADALGVTLALAALLLAIKAERSVAIWFIAGILAGAAALTRYPNAVVGIAIISWATVNRQTRRYALACAVGFICLIAPVFIAQWICLHSPLPQIQALHYAVASFRDMSWDGNAPVDPWYALHHTAYVTKAIARNVELYAVDFLVGPRGLFLLSAGLIAVVLGHVAAPLRRQQKLILLVAGLNFAVHALTWSIPAVKGSRFMLLSYCLMLPFCAAGIVALIRQNNRLVRWLAIGACAVTAGVYVWGCFTAAAYAREECIPLSAHASRHLIGALPPGMSFGSNNPWIISYSTGAPTALLPRNLDKASLANYVSRLDIGAIVLLGNAHSLTAKTVQSYYRIKVVRPGIAVALTRLPRHGQNAYEGRLKIIPQIVQKLPTTHSARIIPRKNGSVRL